MFVWDARPEAVFPEGVAEYGSAIFNTLFGLCIDYAEKIQTAMRRNAPWEDLCMPGREYLKAEAYFPSRWTVGIRVWYDMELYAQSCGDVPYDFGTRHETMTFAQAGAISIILPRGEVEGQGQQTALGSLADELFDAVRALFS